MQIWEKQALVVFLLLHRRNIYKCFFFFYFNSSSLIILILVVFSLVFLTMFMFVAYRFILVPWSLCAPWSVLLQTVYNVFNIHLQNIYHMSWFMVTNIVSLPLLELVVLLCNFATFSSYYNFVVGKNENEITMALL